MSYAVRKDGKGWRSVNDASEVDSVTEIYSVVIPAPSLSRIKEDRIALLTKACQTQIYAGFTSSALGATYSYPANDKDQANLIGSITESLYPNNPAGWTTPFWCADINGIWALRPHTAAQIQQVGADGKASILSAITKNATLAAQVMDAATDTIDKVEAIIW